MGQYLREGDGSTRAEVTGQGVGGVFQSLGASPTVDEGGTCLSTIRYAGGADCVSISGRSRARCRACSSWAAGRLRTWSMNPGPLSHAGRKSVQCRRRTRLSSRSSTRRSTSARSWRARRRRPPNNRQSGPRRPPVHTHRSPLTCLPVSFHLSPLTCLPLCSSLSVPRLFLFPSLGPLVVSSCRSLSVRPLCYRLVSSVYVVSSSPLSPPCRSVPYRLCLFSSFLCLPFSNCSISSVLPLSSFHPSVCTPRRVVLGTSGSGSGSVVPGHGGRSDPLRSVRVVGRTK